MIKLFAIAILATTIIGGDALALPAVQSTQSPKHEVATGHLGTVHSPGRRWSAEVHSYNMGTRAPLDIASGHVTGKRQHKPVPRDAASGLPSGKRMH